MKDDYSPLAIRLAQFMRVMAHPARVAILIHLAKQNTCIEGEIVKGLPISDYSVAHHLIALEKAGLIRGETSTKHSYYCINWDAFNEFSFHFQGVFSDFQQKAQKQNCNRQSRNSSFLCF